MLILAIETTGAGGSVAVLRDDRAAGRTSIDAGRTAQMLTPSIGRLLEGLGIRPGQIDLIAVATGPGSFTGLRVGVTTAKTLAYALDCDIIGIDTLDAIAAQAHPLSAIGRTGGELHVVMDAQRRELFWARFGPSAEEADRAASPWQRLGATEVIAVETWLAQLDHAALVTGPGLKRWKTHLPANVNAVAADLWDPSAETIGRLALSAWRLGRRDDLYRLAPTYIRPSYAEEKVPDPKPAVPDLDSRR